MNLTLSCSSEDTEFINLVQKEFSDKGTIKEFRVSGITGYETVMLVLQIAAVTATTVVPFIISHMTDNKESRTKSKRCFIDNKNKRIYGKLNEIESSLESCKISFLRVHQSFLVNYKHVDGLAYNFVIMDNGKKISISEDRRKVISEQYCSMEDTFYVAE